MSNADLSLITTGIPSDTHEYGTAQNALKAFSAARQKETSLTVDDLLPKEPTTAATITQTGFGSVGGRSLAEADQFGSMTFERWEKRISLDGIISDLTPDSVTVKCLLDEEQMDFQKRVFPVSLFKNFRNLVIDELVIVKINSKPGKIAITVLEGGNGLVDPRPFTANLELENLLEGGLGKVIPRETNL